jgi:hypothetical protein
MLIYACSATNRTGGEQLGTFKLPFGLFSGLPRPGQMKIFQAGMEIPDRKYASRGKIKQSTMKRMGK